MPNSMIDHVDIRVSDVAASRGFYEAALAPLGFAPDAEETDPAGARAIGFRGTGGMAFAIHAPAADPGQDTVTTGAHIAFVASSREAVQAFHGAAVENGGRNIGDPGIRAEYSSRYYGAFVLDPDGNNVEAVFYEEYPLCPSSDSTTSSSPSLTSSARSTGTGTSQGCGT